MKAETDQLKEALAKAKADLALKKEKREVEATKARKKLTKVERSEERCTEAEHQAVEVYKALAEFVIEKARAVAIFWTS